MGWLLKAATPTVDCPNASVAQKNKHNIKSVVFIASTSEFVRPRDIYKKINVQIRNPVGLTPLQERVLPELAGVPSDFNPY